MGSTDWVIIYLSIMRMTALFSGVSLSMATAFVYFILKINPWRMVFYFFILLLRLLSY